MAPYSIPLLHNEVAYIHTDLQQQLFPFTDGLLHLATHNDVRR